MNCIVSPGRATRLASAPNGNLRSFFAAVARYVALLRLSMLPVFAVLMLGTAAHGAQFTLTWTDNSTNESGFRIERAAGLNATTGFAEVATVGANVVSYVDAGLPNSTSYSYRLRAYNSAGNSGFSNTAAGTTPPPSSNTAPTISDIANQTVNAGSGTGALAFTIGDAETAAGSLTVTRASSNTTLVPTANVVLGGSGSSRTVTVTPASGQSGTATITVTVSDGSLSASDTFDLSVTSDGSTVVTSASGFLAQALPSVQTGSFSVEFDATPSSSPIDVVVGLASAAPGSFAEMAAIVRFNTSGAIDVRNGSAYAASQVLNYSAGSTYRFRFVVNVASRSYSVYVTAPGATEVLLAADYAFRTEQAAVTSLGYWCARLEGSGSLAIGTVTVSGVVANTAPTITDIANQTINAGTSSGAIAFTVGDAQTAAGSLVVAASSTNTTLVPAGNVVLGGSGASRTITVTPASGQTGTATITVTVSDGALTTSDSFVLTVNAVNTAPTITDIANRTINEDANTGAIAFTIGDAQTSAGSLTVTRTSSNTTLVPTANVVLGGSGSSRTVTVTPAANQSGTSTITITVSDGSLTATDSFVLTVSAVNDVPTISNIADRSINQDTSTGSISFTIGDVETSASSLSLSASSSNTTLVSSASVAFGGSGSARTVTFTPAPGQSGTTTLTVTVSDGTATASDSFVLTVVSTNTAPSISSQPASATVVAGGAATFSVTATGNPTPAYQWRLNGAAIAGATGSSHSISNAQASHAGTYTVVVSNAAGSVTSSGATLTVTEAIAIIAQPASQSIAKGTKATLTVTAAGTGLSYQWYAGESGDVSAPVSGATSSAYTTPKLSATRSYWVRVSASGQSVNSATATVTVVNAPRTGSGGFGKKTAELQAVPILTAFAATDGTFAVMIDENGLLQMLAIDAASGVVIDAGGVVLDEAGNFSFQAIGVGTVSGQVVGNAITGSISGTDITFSGAIAPVDGSTAGLVGWYNGVVLNSSNGEVIVLANPDGSAFVLTYVAGSVSGGLVIMDTAGTIAVTLPDGRTLSLAINGASGRLTGTTVASGKSDKVSGNRAGDALEKRLVNTSVRAQVRQGDALMVAGFVVGGTGSKKMLVRAVGPALAQFGVTGLLGDPVIRLFRDGNASPIAQNDNWSSAANSTEIASVAATVGAFDLPVGSKDAALLIDLPAGVYTAQVSGVGGQTGMALVEVYDADAGTAIPTNLANISMRGIAGNGDDLVIAGFVVTGNAPKQVLLRAVGTELADFGVTGLAVDPVLRVFSRQTGAEVLIATNNDWGVDAAAVSAAGDRVGAFGLASGSTSSAMVIWLEPGVYTAQASSNVGSSGVALVEVYEVQ